MSVTYDPSSKRWSFTPRTTQELKEVKPPKRYYLNYKKTTIQVPNPKMGGGYSTQEVVVASLSDSEDPKADSSRRLPFPGEPGYKRLVDTEYFLPEYQAIQEYLKKAPRIKEKLEEAKNNERINKTVIEPYNQEVAEYNANLPKAQQVINATKGGDYVAQREALKALGISGIEDNFKSFYLTEKLQPWNTALGAKPVYGDFDASYYKNQNPELAEKYQEAVQKDDVDIVNRYGENGYYLWHYTTQGKASGLRGNAPEATISADKYVEKKPTDRDLQSVRELQLGVNTDTQTERILNVPEIAAEWEKAKNNDPYWKKLGKEKFLDASKPDEFVVLFRLSERPEDQQIRLDYNVNTGYGITELEDAINQAVGEKATVDVKKFGALTQNVLKDTIQKMKEAKAKENMLGLLSGFGGFNEIVDINKELTNSIIGDSGIGGMLAFTSGKKAEESLEKSLQNITGIRNSATYNWQQWFDNELKKKYEQEVELGYSTEEAKDTVKIEADFARQFIDKYLIPRFNTSKSMNEFQEYLDVRQEEQNPFQTQDMLNAVTQIAQLRADKYLDELKKVGDRYFDADFYFNPTGNKASEALYKDQGETVSSDWEAAKKGDPYWKTQAYRFGIDVNNKNDFARMHFEVKGQGKGYDPAEDILTAGRIQDEIYTNILPALQDEALKQGTVFGQFIKPEEFADDMLRGLDQSNKDTWTDVLNKFGLKDFTGTVEDLKDYVAETLRTGSAQQIRDQIKYLNEQRLKPTQERLGLTYIERPEDYKDTQAKPETELYKIFQSSGFQGSEDEFYETMFPDLDRNEQAFLSKADKKFDFKFTGMDLKDPFGALGSIGSFFEEDTDPFADTETEEPASFFSLDYGETDNKKKKYSSGDDLLSDFTSFFKGFS